MQNFTNSELISKTKKKLICLDTETTGLNNQVDRITEIGCVDISNGWEKRTSFQKYVNPQKAIPANIQAICGFNEQFLKDFPTFEHHIAEFLNFIKDGILIIHNARFDIGFLNAELKRYNHPPLDNDFIDTVELAKKQFPGKKVNLNALKDHFQIDIAREYHGALLDAEILAQVYIAMQTTQTTLNPNDQNTTKNSTKIFPSKKLIEILI